MNLYPTRNVLGVPITSITLSDIPRLVISLIESGGKKTLFYVNAHTLNIAGIDKDYKKILEEASLVYSGGLGPVLASKILGQPLPGRAPTPDFIDEVLSACQKKKWSVYLLGTKEEPLKLFIDSVKRKFPSLDICGSHHGYFTKHEENNIISEINLLKPAILIVGMGTPKQEKWIDDNSDRIDTKAFWAVGALFDVMAGVLPRAPKWMQTIGLEWLFRFFQEPRRLWKRYLIGNCTFILSTLLTKLTWQNKIKLAQHLTNNLEIV